MALNKVTSTNETYLGTGYHSAGGGVKLEAKTLEVGSGESADTQNEFRAEAVSGAGAQDVGVAGALAVNLVDRRTAAYIKDNATAETGGGSVTVSASDRSKDVAKALPWGCTSGSDAGIGAPAALNVLSRTLASRGRWVSARSGAIRIWSDSTHDRHRGESGSQGRGRTAASAISLSRTQYARLGSARDTVHARSQMAISR